MRRGRRSPVGARTARLVWHSSSRRSRRSRQCRIQLGAQLGRRGFARFGKRSDHDPTARRQRIKTNRHLCSQPTGNPMTHDATADRSADDESYPRRVIRGQVSQQVHDECTAPGAGTTPDDGGEVTRPPHSVRPRNHESSCGLGSGRQGVAALAPASRDDGAPGACTHTQPEAVRLGTSAVVRLVGPLAHGRAPSRLFGLTTTKYQCARNSLLRVSQLAPGQGGRSAGARNPSTRWGPIYGTDPHRPGSNQARAELNTLLCAACSPPRRHAASVVRSAEPLLGSPAVPLAAGRHVLLGRSQS